MASSLSVSFLVLCALNLAQAQLRVFDLRASDLPYDIFGITDAYVKVYVGTASLGKTATRANTIHPWWDEEFTYFHAQENDILRLDVHDADLLFHDVVGSCERQLKPGTYHYDCFLEEGGTLHYSYTLDQ
ncbi:double C2-like domain-containing protein alpha [Cyprinodon tularosa]|uniref:double C2-like domain-containing protein alpha n=1 Tax=Cyprinodon tularosa TaxID=77115 RepID=UPI0018E23518|nr:double C2-like domain-containing protein alpha [Cyprinodon tularosa]